MITYSSNKSLLQQILWKLLLFIAIICIGFFGANFLIPLVFACTLAMLILPVVQFLKKRGWGEFVAISMAVGLLLAFFLIFAGIIIWQGATLSEEVGVIKEQWAAMEQSTMQYIDQSFNISIKLQEQKLSNFYSSLTSAMIQYTGEFTRIAGDWFLTFAYVVVILIERKRLKIFMLKLVDNKNHDKAMTTVQQMVATVNDYLYGHLKVTIILAIVYAIGFLIAGLKFSIVLALVAALLTIIPYLGNIIGAVLMIIISVISGNSVQVLLALIAFLGLVQFAESYILKPWIIGNEISLNILAIIISVVGFSLMWGISGSILALPLASIIRILCSKMEALRPYEYLLSDKKVSS